MAKKRVARRIPSIKVDQFNTDILEAIGRKLSRDYLEFFRSVTSIYKEGPLAKSANEALEKTKKTIILLSEVIRKGITTREDAKDLVGSIGEINGAKDTFLEEVQKSEAFRSQVQAISETVGVSPEDLSITKEVVQKGIKQVRRGREGVPGFLKRTMPGAVGAAREVAGGVGAAVLGPFGPMAMGTLREAYGLGRGIAGKLQERREAKLAARLRPAVAGYPPEVFERVAARRAGGVPVSGIRGYGRRRSKEEMTAPFMDFFNRKAYQARWTKELLKYMKDLSKGMRGRDMFDGFGIGGLLENFKGLGAAIVPLIGSGGSLLLLAGAVAGAVVALNKIKDAAKVFTKMEKERGKAREAAAHLMESEKRRAQEIKAMGVEEYARRAGKTPEEVAIEMTMRREKAALALRAHRERGPLGLALRKGKPLPEIEPYGERLERVKREIGLLGVKEFVPPERGVEPTGMESSELRNAILEQIEQTKRLGIAFEESTKRLENIGGDRTATEAKGPGLGDVNDSADTLLNEHASGELVLED